MINNPERSIKTDWAAQDIVKPTNMNALTSAVPYDFIITKERVDEYSTDHSDEFMDVGDLIWGGLETEPDYSCGGRKSIHILLNFATTIDDKFDFGGKLTKVKDHGVEEVHIHSLSSYSACGTSLNIYYHTSGSANYVHFLNLDGRAFYVGAYLHVGAFATSEALPWPSNGPAFIYEKLLEGSLPSHDGTPTSYVWPEMWLTNTKEAISSPIIDCSLYKIYFNREKNKFCWGSGISSQIFDNASIPSSDAQTAVSSIISKIDDVLSAGLVPVLKFRLVGQEYYTDYEYYFPMVRRGCCDFFFIWPRQRLETLLVKDNNGDQIGCTSIYADLQVFIGAVRKVEENFYTIILAGDERL